VTKKPYLKPLLTFEQQAQLLVSRGMGGDIATIAKKLQIANYYRLSGYFYFFRQHQGASSHLGEQFQAGTHFDRIWDLYTFDSCLRCLIFEAIERIEIAVRTQVSFCHADKFGAFAYAIDPKSLPDIGMRERDDGTFVSRRIEFLQDLDKNLGRSNAPFIEHFYEKYSDPYPPIWIGSEVLTLGGVLYVFDGSPVDVRTKISAHFGLPHPVFGSWLLTLNTARNVCAHHGRFWNRAIGSPPMIPPEKRYAYWHKPVEIFPPFVKGTGIRPTTFVILSMCNHLLTEIAPGCGWAKKVKALLDLYPNVPRRSMGIPENWTLSPVWNDID